jgi:hypothetical protein
MKTGTSSLMDGTQLKKSYSSSMPKKRTLDLELTPVEWLLEQLEERGHIIPDHLQETALNKEKKLQLDNPKTVVEHIFYNWESMSRLDFDEYMLNNKQTLLREEKEQMEDYAEEMSLSLEITTMETSGKVFKQGVTTTEDSSPKISVHNDVTYAKSSLETPTASLSPDGITETPIQQVQDYIQNENTGTLNWDIKNVLEQIQDYIRTENLIGRERELVKDACISAIMQWHEWNIYNADLYDHKVEGAEIWAEQYCKKLYKDLD